MRNNLLSRFRNINQLIYVPLLVFLLVFTVDKIALKFAGILLIYILHPDFNFKKNLKKIPQFYILIILLELIKFFLFNRDFSKGHSITLLLGCLFWLISFLCLHQLKSILDNNDERKISNTVTLFFLINSGISLFNLLLAIYHSGSIDPYRLQDQEFGTSTGDLIKGLFMGPSYINMMINSLFLFYFLYQKKFKLAFLGAFVAIITTSNFANLILLPVLIFALIFKKDAKIRLVISFCLMLYIIFYLFISPSNLKYLKDSIWVSKKHEQEMLAYEKEAAKNESASKKDSLSSSVNNVQYTPEKVDKLLENNAQTSQDSSLSLNLNETRGKVLSFKETYSFLKSGPKNFLLGAGVGCFSSFLAERMSGVNKEEGSRLFTYLPNYKSKEFENNHYKIFKTIYSLPKAFHSVKHFPNSFINQLFGEYGILGALLFLFTYVFFFVRNFFRLSYGKYLIFLLGGFLLFDYLFEYLSVVVIFELLMLIDIKKIEKGKSRVTIKRK